MGGSVIEGGRSGRWPGESAWRGHLWIVIPALSALLVLGIAAYGLIALVVVLAVAMLLWSLLDIRFACLAAVLLASFVDTGGGHMVIQLAVVYGWLAWTALLTFWRGAWRATVIPPARIRWAILIWLGICLFGAIFGWLAGNSLRILLLEWLGAVWPGLAFLVCQVQSRKSLPYAGVGLTLIALAHTVFGLAWLKVAQHRLGGVYFTTVPGFVAVGVWVFILLTPRQRTRWVAFAVLVPLLAHQFFSFTRGYWMGIFAGILTATVLAWRGLEAPALRRMSSRWSLVAGSVAVLVATALFSVSYFGKEEVLKWAGKRFESSFSLEASGETGSNIMRLSEYSLAIDGARASPIVGKGWGYTITNRDPFTGVRFPQGVIHNYYLFLWLKLGIVGLIGFAFYCWQYQKGALDYSRQEQEWLPRAWGVASIAMTVQALVICLTNYSLNDFCTGIFLAYVWGTVLALQARPKTV